MSKKDKIKAVVYYWNTKNCYSGFMAYSDVKKYVNIVKDQSMNRVINEASVDMIVKYMKSEGEEIFFPPVIMNSSDKIKYDSSFNTLELEEGSLTIIDGQHRIKSINEILSDSDSVSEFSLKKIPFVIIEELSPELHRKLFHTINDKSTKVQNNVSDRFSTTTYNLIGLKYVSEHLEIKEIIEWEGKQSKEKIVYSHMLNCIEMLEGFLKGKFKDTLDGIEGVLVENKKHLYKHPHYYAVFEIFWNYIFNKLKDKPLDKSFYVKEISLSYITKVLIDSLNEELINDDLESLVSVKDKIYSSVDNLLPKELVFDYVFRVNKSFECNESLKKFLDCNKQLLEDGISLKHKASLNKILTRIIPKIFLDNGGYFSVDTTNYEHFTAYLNKIDGRVNDLLAQNKGEKEIIKIINEEEKVVEGALAEAGEQAAAEETTARADESANESAIKFEVLDQENEPVVEDGEEQPSRTSEADQEKE